MTDWKKITRKINVRLLTQKNKVVYYIFFKMLLMILHLRFSGLMLLYKI